MAPNLPPSITVNRNLASTLRAFIRQNGGKNVSEVQMNQILQRVAKFDAERDAGTREGGSIFDGGSKYLGGSGKDFRVKQGQQIQFSAEEYNAIFEGFIEPLEIKKETKVETPPKVAVETPSVETPSVETPQKPVSEVKEEPVEVVAEQKDNPQVKNSANELLDKNVKILFPNGLPEGVTASYVNIGGAQTLIFKQDGKTLDQAQLRKLVSAQKDAAPVENEKVSQAPDLQAESVPVENLNTENSSDVPAQAREKLSEKAQEVMDAITSLKPGEVYQFEKVTSELQSNNGELEKVYSGTIYNITKDENGNITVTDHFNDVSVYDSNGQMVLSNTRDSSFDIHNEFGSLRSINDYKNNTETIDLTNLSLSFNNKESFIDRIARFDNMTVYNDEGAVLFSSEKAAEEVDPQTGEYSDIYHFKGSDGKDLSKEEVLELISSNKLSKLVRKTAFNLDYVKEHETLERNLLYNIN